MAKLIDYMQRTRRFYRAKGFAPYQWAQHETIPWQQPRKPLADSRVALISTAVPDETTIKSERVATSWALSAAPLNFGTQELSWDKQTTDTNDRRTYFPLEDLLDAASNGYIGSVAPRFHFLPTHFSQRRTLTGDGPAIASACIDDEVDIAILVPL
jgi:D-proline reductase (dithiol) PrdB